MRQRPAATVATCVPVFMIFMDATVVNVAFPSIQASFSGTSLAGLSWVLSAYSICFAALLVPFGRLADVVSARRVFLVGIVVFVAASGLCALASSVPMLIAARALQGLGGAAIAPAAQALLLASVPREQRTSAMSLLAAVAGVAAALGPPLGALLVDAGDWRLVFLINVPIGVAALLGWRVLPESLGRTRQMPDLGGGVLVAVVVGLLALGLVQGPWWGWTDPMTIGTFLGAAVGVRLFLLRCARHPAPVVPLPLFRVRTFSAGNAGALLVGVAFYGLLLGNSLFLTSVWGWSILTTGLALAPTPLVTAVVAMPASRYAERHGPLRLLVAGAVTVAAAAVWFVAKVTGEPDFLAHWLPGAVLLGVGLGLAYPLFSAVSVVDLDADSFGLGSGVSAMTRQLGAVLGVTTLVAVIGHPAADEALGAFRRGWLVAAAVALVAVVPALFLRHGLAASTDPAPSRIPVT